MLILNSYGKNIYLDEDLIGYISREGLYMNGKKFADITDEGIISVQNKKVGYIDDEGSIIINNNEVGYVDGDNNFVFYKSFVYKNK